MVKIKKVFKLTGSKVSLKEKGVIADVVTENKSFKLPMEFNENLVDKVYPINTDKGDMFNVVFNKTINGENSFVLDSEQFSNIENVLKMRTIGRVYQNRIIRRVQYAEPTSNNIFRIKENSIELVEYVQFPLVGVKDPNKELSNFYKYLLSDKTEFLVFADKEARPKPIEEEARPAA